jgi:hypothetical protein
MATFVGTARDQVERILAYAAASGVALVNVVHGEVELVAKIAQLRCSELASFANSLGPFRLARFECSL